MGRLVLTYVALRDGHSPDWEGATQRIGIAPMFELSWLAGDEEPDAVRAALLSDLDTFGEPWTKSYPSATPQK